VSPVPETLERARLAAWQYQALERKAGCSHVGCSPRARDDSNMVGELMKLTPDRYNFGRTWL